MFWSKYAHDEKPLLPNMSLAFHTFLFVLVDCYVLFILFTNFMCILLMCSIAWVFLGVICLVFGLILPSILIVSLQASFFSIQCSIFSLPTTSNHFFIIQPKMFILTIYDKFSSNFTIAKRTSSKSLNCSASQKSSPKTMALIINAVRIPIFFLFACFN